jgi:glycosyltransferase involved in cell wall biosynthesis
MKSELKVSIITVVYNNSETIADCIDSVLNQSYPNIEYIIIDGESTDGTVDVVNKYGNKITTFISEPDKGLYDAMNKGINLSTGDIVGIISSDDLYINDSIVEEIVDVFEATSTESVYADMLLVSRDNINKTIRYYDSSHFSPTKFAYGWMPAHPTFFVKKHIYDKYGVFKLNYKIGADFDILCRFLYVNNVSYQYIQKPIIRMRLGGVSTSFSSIYINNIETLRACRENGIKTNIFNIISKYPKKLLGFFKS